MANEYGQNLVAPCGIYCGVCRAYLAYSRNIPKARGKVTHCAGCRPRHKQCAYIKGQCEKLRLNQIEFCFQCVDFPCQRLKNIDSRYQRNYNYSFIANLEEIKASGVVEFIRKQEERFRCPRCNGVISVHDGKCYDCIAQKAN